MRLIPDAMPHHLRGVVDDDEGVGIVSADDLFQCGQFPEIDDRIDDLLFAFGIPPFPAEGGYSPVDLVKNPSGDLPPLG